MTVGRYKQTRFWAVYDGDGGLIAVTVYKKGALEVARRLDANDKRLEADDAG